MAFIKVGKKRRYFDRLQNQAIENRIQFLIVLSRPQQNDDNDTAETAYNWGRKLKKIRKIFNEQLVTF